MSDFFKLLASAGDSSEYLGRKLLLLTIAIKRDPQFAALLASEEYATTHEAFFKDNLPGALANLQPGIADKVEAWVARKEANGAKLVELIDAYITQHEIVHVSGGEHINRMMQHYKPRS